MVAGPAIGFGCVWSFCWGRARTILTEEQRDAESVFRAEIPFANPPESRVESGRTSNVKNAELMFSVRRQAPAMVEYYRKVLPRDWVQFRDWETSHVFASPTTHDCRYEIRVDLSDQEWRRINLRKTDGPVPKDVEAKLLDLNGNPLR